MPPVLGGGSLIDAVDADGIGGSRSGVIFGGWPPGCAMLAVGRGGGGGCEATLGGGGVS